MLELHHAFLNNLKTKWVNGYPENKDWNNDMESGAANLIAMMESNQFNINEKDNDGNTLLHLLIEIYCSDSVFSSWHYPVRKIIKTALQMGADPTIKNNKKLTPIEINLIANKYEWSYFSQTFSELIQFYHPDVISILEFLEGFSKNSCAPFIYQGNTLVHGDITNIFDLHLLPLDTLKAMLSWSTNIIEKLVDAPNTMIFSFKDKKSAEEFRENIKKQINLLENAIDLPIIINQLIIAKGSEKMILFRTMLLDNPPLASLLNGISEEGILTSLPEDQQALLKNFIDEYEQKRCVLEELSAIPTPLTENEFSFAKPICDKLNSILYNLQAPNTDIGWKKRAEEAEASPQQRMIERYANYQTQDKKQRISFFNEFNRYQKQIENGFESFLEKQRQRNKLEAATEKRISKKI